MLAHLTLAQFRSHARLSMDLDGRPLAIFGPNGAGKTNILEAVSLLSPGRGLRRAAPDELARHPGTLGWKIRARLGAGSEIETGAAPGAARSVRIDEKAAPQVALGGLLRILWLVPSMDRLWTEAPEGRRRFLDRLTLSFHPDHAETVLAYEKAMRDRNRLLRDGVRDGAWFAALEATMAEAAVRIRAGRAAALDRIMAAQAEAATGFPAADLAVTDAGPEDLAAALARGRARDMAAGRTLEGPHRADLTAVWAARGTPAALASTGEQKALLVSIVLANARALAAEGAPVVVLLDEVAAHLDADRRAALYDEICALGLQALMTGTGPELFDALGDRGGRMALPGPSLA
ncbi:DNA replication/repair protein RecF [Phaeovulum vinaykumarii]|uniref:DNA replication and repair protein RecF n=1 Tax=Phaeovulum vinaykumarii TaxID=407234 RepID=A0A1N7M955_9RHOB|nr:DNA replication/repair protein RecF [Phaeovulum vinaykumarii]SIS82572.1 DNA replication and repair protein RecF [Phaeovulum vinaykumarii]SOC10868.1 DNA replication and repair protein RecF [Phaeovulum vinaykumarii]